MNSFLESNLSNFKSRGRAKNLLLNSEFGLLVRSTGFLRTVEFYGCRQGVAKMQRLASCIINRIHAIACVLIVLIPTRDAKTEQIDR